MGSLLSMAVVCCGTAALALDPGDALKISEILYDPAELPASAYEFIELVNAGADTLYLDGAVITDQGNNDISEATFKFPGTPGGTSLPLAPGAHLLLVPDATGSGYPGIDWEFYAGAPDSDDPAIPNLVKTSGLANNLSLGNAGDGITVSTGYSTGNVIPCDEVVDGVSWEGGGGDVTALSDSVCTDPASHPGSSSGSLSLQRLPDVADSDNSAADFSLAPRTPGACNVCPPQILTVSVVPCPPDSSQPTTFFVFIQDDDSDVSLVDVSYRVQPDSSFVSIPAVGDQGFYSTSLPLLPSGTVVDYFVVVSDSAGNMTAFPPDAPATFASLRIGITSIASIQSAAAADSCASSLWVGSPVNVTGIVTHYAREFADDYFFMQEDTVRYSGIRIAIDPGSFMPQIGDSVVVSGLVRETLCQTEVQTQQLCIVDSGKQVLARQLSKSETNNLEAFEGMLVRLEGPLTVVTPWLAEEAGGETRHEFLSLFPLVWVGDDTNEPDGIGVTPVLNVNSTILSITGIVSFRLGVIDSTHKHRIEPRRGNDLEVDTTDVPGEPPAAWRRLRLEPAPNPFNPTTTLTLGMPQAGLTSLRIYDAAGRLVRTLFSGPVEAGERRIVWDGRDAAGTELPAGVYVARLEGAGGAVSRKLVLVR